MFKCILEEKEKTRLHRNTRSTILLQLEQISTNLVQIRYENFVELWCLPSPGRAYSKSSILPIIT